VNLADSFDAMTTDRPYKRRRPRMKCSPTYNEIRASNSRLRSCKHFSKVCITN
jgi:HD-GYP domain-containing protein (c-di-GMP phosphodiesterase class II)